MINVTVKTALPIGNAAKAKVEKFISEKTGEGYVSEYLTDARLLGGIVIKIGDIVYDGSVKRQIDKIRQNL